MVWKHGTSVFAGLILVGTVLIGAACTGPSTEQAEIAAEQDAATAGEFTLEDVRGDQVGLAASAGQVRLIDFWATWCAPCREEIPMLKELHRVYGPQGLTILAISDENEQLIRDFVLENEIPYTNLVDAGEIVSKQYGVVSLPTAFLVDGEGKIIEEFRGTKPRSVLESKIREMLGLAPA